MLEQWDQAEELIRIDAERYEDSRLNWYFWCRRTEKGNIKAATSMASKHVGVLTKGSSPTNHLEVAVYNILTGKTSPARDLFRDACKANGDIYSGLHWILLSDEMSDKADREAAFRNIADNDPKMRTRTPEYTAHLMLVKWLEDEYEQPAEHEADKENSANCAYFVGRYFQLRGKAGLAEQYYKRCVDSHQMKKWNVALATVRLRDSKTDERKKGDSQEGVNKN
jgi:hypothetical protein